MTYENSWPLADSITAAVDAMGLGVWDLRYDQPSGMFFLELTAHLSDDSIGEICSQLSISADYEGEGDHGSLFRLYPWM